MSEAMRHGEKASESDAGHDAEGEGAVSAPEQPVTLATFDRLAEYQRGVLGLIAIGQDGGHHPSTLKALERRGLIVGHFQRLGVGTSVEVVVQRWEVPIPVHIVWCQWCSIHAPNEEAADA